MKNFVEELRWRGMLAQIMPGTEELLQKEMVTAYLGTDPTADSLHIGHLCGIMMLRHLQRCGHKPIILVGGATGMIGDPSGKSQERNLLTNETLYHNQECIKKQVAKFLDFESNEPNAAEMVNNYDWMKDFTFLDFAREVGKHITVNYMMAKDSVQQRLNGTARDGLSFTEFTYQLLQGYDFLYLYEHKGVKLQLGGNDQWGNLTSGLELIRKLDGDKAEAEVMTAHLITRADGKKFGKSEKGALFLDRNLTSPYQLYQYFINTTDEDAVKYLKVFTFLSHDEIEDVIREHLTNLGMRVAQKKLAYEVTKDIHGAEAAEEAALKLGKKRSDWFLNPYYLTFGALGILLVYIIVMLFMNRQPPLNKIPVLDEAKIFQHNAEYGESWTQGKSEFWEGATLADAKRLMTTSFASHSNINKCIVDNTQKIHKKCNRYLIT